MCAKTSLHNLHISSALFRFPEHTVLQLGQPVKFTKYLDVYQNGNKILKVIPIIHGGNSVYTSTDV